jgi:hypothetical protein
VIPAAGLPLISSVAPVTKPAVSNAAVTPNAVAWVNSTYTEVDPAIGADWTLGAVVYQEGDTTVANAQFEVDIAIGAAGSEVVVTTVRGDHGGNFWGMGPQIIMLRPMANVLPSGSRVAIRMRKKGANTNPWHFRLVVYPSFNEPDAVTALPQTILPAAANSISLPAGGGWGNGAWTEFSAALANDTAIVGFTLTGASVDSEIDIGIGAAGSEVVMSTTRSGGIAADRGGEGSYTMGLGLVLPSGSRVALRNRSRNATAVVMSLSVIEHPDFTYQSPFGEVCYPPAANAIQPNPGGTAWVPGAWVELIASATAGTAITAVTYTPGGLAGVEGEIQFGIGAAGSEVKVAALRVAGESNDTSHTSRRTLPIPLCLSGGDRVAIRIAENSANTSAWSVAVMANNGI